MLKNDATLADFYTLKSVSKDAENYTCVIVLNPGHPVYEGHFPEIPVTPGACMMQIIKETASTVSNLPLRYAQVQSCKFLSVVNPFENPELELTFTLTENYGIQAVFLASGTPALKLKATLTPVL